MRITLAINPGDLAVNGRLVPRYDPKTKHVTGRLVLSPKFRDALNVATVMVRQAKVKQGWTTSKKMLRVSIFTRWPGPDGDTDAVCKGVIDSLQEGLIVVNDKQCRPITLDAAWNCKEPGIDVELEEIADA